ncbi:MAG: hypothetical protein R2932_16150 [Caldilineaceae bacterium]
MVAKLRRHPGVAGDGGVWCLAAQPQGEEAAAPSSDGVRPMSAPCAQETLIFQTF